MAWSSVEDKEVMTHNVFRETALHNAQVELLPGETWSNEVEWIIFAGNESMIFFNLEQTRTY